MNISTTLKRGITAVLAVSLIAYMFLQQDKIRLQAERIMQLEGNVTFFKASLESVSAELETTEIALEEAEEEIRILQDSTVFLNSEMEKVANYANRKKAEVNAINRELAHKVEEVDMLKGAITDWQAKGLQDAEKIQALELRLKSNSENISQLQSLKENAEKELTEARESQIYHELERNRLSRIQNVIQNTKVDYKTVACKTTKSGKALSKIKNDGSSWVFTTLEFSLENDDQSFVVGEYFRLKIVDAESGEPLAYNEANPAFAENSNETIGYTFLWESNPTEVTYINMQAKTGRSYNAQIFYVNNDKEYLIASSVLPIIGNGKMLK